MPAPEAAEGQSLFRRLAFRIPAIYLLLYGLPQLLPMLPRGVFLGDWWFLRTEAVGRWVILHVIRLPEHNTPPFTDSLSQFLYCLVLVAVSLAVALVWSLIAARKDDSRFKEWVRTLVRLSLAVEMFSYGWSKLIPFQFWGGQVPLHVVSQPVGQLSPQGLLWAMMGYSRLYAVFAGAMEWSGALLLCFRRTTMLGALITIAALTNVVMLNFGFDVGVKVHAVNLLLMALFVAAPDARYLLNVLIFKAPRASRPDEPLFRGTRLARAAIPGAILLAAWILLTPLIRMLPDLREFRPAPPLYGVLEVDSFSRNGASLPPLAGDSVRWRRIVFERNNRATITYMSDSAITFRSAIDTAGRVITLNPARVRGIIIPKRMDTVRLSYARPDESHLVLRGRVGVDSVMASLHYVPLSSYFLLTARHRWGW